MANFCRRAVPQHVKRAVLDDWTESDWDRVYCYHCLEESDLFTRATCRLPRGFEWDHLVPVSMGGANTADNIRIACAPCNRSKGARIDWIGPLRRWEIAYERGMA